jgi:3'-phosphoadenosine 5'-phosphosulfate sulfotransferase (PAPS reductase)/FAD synthetase
MTALFDLPSTLPRALESSQRIFREAMEVFQPTHIASMVSGGTDSAVSDALAVEMGIKIDLRIHGRTGCGVQATTQFCIDHYGRAGEFALADAGNAYERYVMRKGFFGTGRRAHNFAYRILKADPFKTAISQNIRRRKRGVRVMLINGARKYESDNRRINLPVTRLWKGNMWVNLIHEWSDEDKAQYIASRQVTINPVARQLCRSAECLCGTMQDPEDLAEASVLYPEFGSFMKDLNAEAKRLHGFGWGEPHPKPVDPNQLKLFDDLEPEPMCGGCLRRKKVIA